MRNWAGLWDRPNCANRKICIHMGNCRVLVHTQELNFVYVYDFICDAGPFCKWSCGEYMSACREGRFLFIFGMNSYSAAVRPWMTHFKYRYIHICENKNKGDELDFFLRIICAILNIIIFRILRNLEMDTV